MPDIIDHVSYLSEEIGPRPGGTEEEQQAALYIADYLQKEAGLAAEIEDFAIASNTETPSLICAGILLVAVVLGLAVPAIGILAFFLALVSGGLMLAESLGKPVLSRMLGKGVSQNVVAKYEPAAADMKSSHRKIVIVSHYDSGKVQAELNEPLLGILPIIKLCAPVAAAVTAILLLIRGLALGNASGAPVVVVSIITVIAAIIAIAPGIFALAHRTAGYSAGANCNASGVAVLMETAARVGSPTSAVENHEKDPVIHGEEAARVAGVVPNGASVIYETAQAPAGSAEARLAQAKAAIAAISGKPVPGAAPVFDISENLVQVKDEPLGKPSAEDMQALREDTSAAFAPIPAEAAAALQEQIAAQADAAEAALAASRPQPAAQGSPIEGYLDKEMSQLGSPYEAAYADASQQNAPAAAEMVVEDDGSSVPAWFARAQEKAKRPKNDDKPVHRSRYADALDAAVSASSAHFREANEAVVSETEQRLAAMRDSIKEVKAPGFEGEGGDTTFAVIEQERVSIAGERDQAIPDWSMPEWTKPVDTSAASITVEPVSAEATPIASNEAPSQSVDAPAGEQRVSATAIPPVTPVQDAASMPNAQAGAAGSPAPASAEEYATCAMTPIDVTGLREEAAAQAAAEAPAPFVAPLAAEANRTAQAPTLEAITAEDLKPVAELKKQRAPLADASKGKKSPAERLRAQIPSIESSSQGQTEAAPTHPSSMSISSLRGSLPSLSGSITLEKPVEAPQESETAEETPADATVAINQIGSFAPASATGSFAPVDEELFENVADEDIYVDDADDSAYDGTVTETGAFAGPGYVEMPKSRVRKFFDRFSRKKKQEDAPMTPQEWLDVDDSFDARTVGADRGGWESFRDDSASYEADVNAQAGYGEYSQDEYDDDYYYDEDDSFHEDKTTAFEPASGDGSRRGGRSRWNGGAFSRISMGNANVRSEEEIVTPDMMPEPVESEEDEERIYHFHNPEITTEVWFVALGCELSGHNGMKAFLSDHADELRGAIIVDLEAMGAGSLSLIESEGTLRKVSVSSRMKRYVKKAAQATGAHVGSATIPWGEGSGAYAAQQGFQAMHLAGMDGTKPAFFAQKDDTIDVVKPDNLSKNVEFVVEMLKNI